MRSDFYKIEQLFNMQDYAKDKLLNSETSKEEKNAKKILKITNSELEELYIFKL